MDYHHFFADFLNNNLYNFIKQTNNKTNYFFAAKRIKNRYENPTRHNKQNNKS